MPSCNPCLKVCNVPVCTEEIIIGTITDVNTDIYIVAHNKTTGRKQYVSTQSDAGGVVTLVTSGLGLMPEHSYELAVVPRPGSPCDKYTITIGEFEGTCVSVTFENAKDSEGCPVVFTSVELEVETDPQPATGCVCVTQAMVDEWDASSDGSMIYRALISQSGANNPPTAIVLRNDFGVEVFTFAYDAAGQYQINSPNNSFTANKTFARMPIQDVFIGSTCVWNSDSSILLRSAFENPQLYSDDLLELTPLEIIVYP